jgi:hypothetical protein
MSRVSNTNGILVVKPEGERPLGGTRRSLFLATDRKVPGSIPGAARFSEE